MTRDHNDSEAVANATKERPTLDDQERYWQRRLSGDAPILDACLDNARPPFQSYHREEQTLGFSSTTTADIHAFCDTRQCSLFVLLLTGLKTAWIRHGAEPSLVIGTPAIPADQTAPREDRCSLTNVLPVCTDLPLNCTVSESLERTEAAVREAQRNGDYPFARMIPFSHHDVTAARAPIFQTMLLPPDHRARGSGDSEGEWRDVAAYSTACDAVFTFSENEGHLAIRCDYDVELFHETTIISFLTHLRVLVGAMIEDNQCQLLDLPILDQEEETRVLFQWNRTADAHTPIDRSFSELFEGQTAQHPDAIAAQFGEHQLSYGHLNRVGDSVAHTLRQMGIGPETVVAVLEQRGLTLLQAILGIWKAGAAYLPLDPRHPSKRIAQVLAQSCAPIVMVGRSQMALLGEARSNFAQKEQPRIVPIEDLMHGQATAPDTHLDRVPTSLAYVIFTSGSTGAPKGAMVEQRGMINHLFAKIRDLGLEPGDIVAQTASQCFDISVWQFMSPLLAGGRVHVFEDDVVYDAGSLLKSAARHGVTVLQTVPSFLDVVLGEQCSQKVSLAQLRWLISTGEALPVELCRRWLARYPKIPVVNAYGPTECSDDVTHHFVTAADEVDATVPIGRPLCNTQIYIVDQNFRPQPAGVRGELLAGGIGVGRGYCASPDQTADAFIPDPFARTPGARLYRTQDTARWSSNGQLDYLGRSDDQLKLRGFRIEPREIEIVLTQYSTVQDAVVTLREDCSGDAILVAYLLSPEGPAIDDLHKFARNRLPPYMLPAAYVILETLPRTANGKLDRAALPAPTPEARPRADDYQSPRTVLETALSEKWASLFGVERVGLRDNFLDLGGHSLLATQLVSWIYDKFQVKLSVRDVFDAPTVDRLAERIDTIGWVAGQRQTPKTDDQEEFLL